MVRARTALLCCILLLVSTAFARFTVEQVLGSPFPSGLTTAKDAPRIAWVFNARGVRNVWVGDAPGFAARQVTHYSEDDGQEIASLKLTPDGRTAVYARGSETNGKGEVANPNSSVKQPHQQVWAVDIEEGKPRLLGTMECAEEGCEDIQISPDGKLAVWPARKQIWIAPISAAEKEKALTYARGDNKEPKWSPDGKQVAFTSDRGDHSFIGVYDFAGDSIRWLEPTVDRDRMPRWSPDGKQIAFVRLPGKQRGLPLIPIRPEPWSIWVAGAASGRARQVWRSSEDENGSFPALTADESFQFGDGRIVFASEQDGWNHLYSVAPAGAQATLLTPGKFEVEDVVLSADLKSVLYTSNQDDVDRRHVWRVAIGGGTPQALSRGETIEWSPVESAGVVVCIGSTATSPAMPYRLTASGREMIAREALPGDFPTQELVTPKLVTFKAEDGLEIHGQLFEPRGRKGPAPAVIFIHGGSMRQMMLGFHNMRYYHQSYAENQYLASLGYVVLSVNYRTGIMYGRAFREPHGGGWRGAAEYKDIVAAGRYLQSLASVDKSKIGLWGGSYGGYLTAMGLARDSALFAAGVDIHGVHDWAVFLPKWGELTGDTSGSEAPDLAEARKLAFESSPNAAVAKWRSPVLLIHGDDDRNVPFDQTVDLAQRLRAQKVAFEQMIFPDEIHDLLMWKSWIRAYQGTAEFFERVMVRGQAAP